MQSSSSASMSTAWCAADPALCISDESAPSDLPNPIPGVSPEKAEEGDEAAQSNLPNPKTHVCSAGCSSGPAGLHLPAKGNAGTSPAKGKIPQNANGGKGKSANGGKGKSADGGKGKSGDEGNMLFQTLNYTSWQTMSVD